MGAKPAPQTKDTLAVKTQAKTSAVPAINKTPEAKADSAKPKTVKIPKLVDLGASKCIPCKMMAPILEELEKEYKGKMDVVFIDVWKNPDEGSKYKVRVIPTQIFYSPEGKELFRHEGFYSKEDILAKWKELGYQLKK
ncbi:MAG: thioredoxin family protein [Candidatus Edwardsbacteria bacterium]|nr:thioredoxin family protein [Candidatus Edwardsbacteria bacterium]MBU1575898.1 thioredoxin family protein [Candidatus Edwardsbacteria bacterium]MBU2464330.1 thioredoxin family protein [Candidatus Edwardsbacteria bacterium]MBU2593111.1 thioredoxin family protein [Candidatus Edwardsbacteria bacterium]